MGFELTNGTGDIAVFSVVYDIFWICSGFLSVLLHELWSTPYWCRVMSGEK
jgi:hypothetical protein